jgi:hypothetical protein
MTAHIYMGEFDWSEETYSNFSFWKTLTKATLFFEIVRRDWLDKKTWITDSWASNINGSHLEDPLDLFQIGLERSCFVQIGSTQNTTTYSSKDTKQRSLELIDLVAFLQNNRNVATGHRVQIDCVCR